MAIKLNYVRYTNILQRFGSFLIEMGIGTYYTVLILSTAALVFFANWGRLWAVEISCFLLMRTRWLRDSPIAQQMTNQASE